MEEHRNIVQAEFFHVGGKNTHSLGDLFAECRERTSDDIELISGEMKRDTPTSMKTAVRFYDGSGILTNAALKFKALEEREKALATRIFSGAESRLRQRMLNFRASRLAGKILAMKERNVILAATELRVAYMAKEHIAVERPDRHFTLARGDELYELLEAAAKAKNVWFFVFEPNNLLADKNTVVAHAW